MIIALSQVSTLHSPFADDVEEFSASECNSIDAWLTKLEQYVADHSLDRARQLLDECGVTMPVASFQGGLLHTQGDQRKEAWQLFEQRLALCRELKIGTMVVACDVPIVESSQDFSRIQMSLAQAAEQAAAHEVKLALEIQANRQATASSLLTMFPMTRIATIPMP